LRHSVDRLLLAAIGHPEATSALPGCSIVGLPDKTIDHPVAHSWPGSTTLDQGKPCVSQLDHD